MVDQDLIRKRAWGFWPYFGKKHRFKDNCTKKWWNLSVLIEIPLQQTSGGARFMRVFIANSNLVLLHANRKSEKIAGTK